MKRKWTQRRPGSGPMPLPGPANVKDKLFLIEDREPLSCFRSEGSKDAGFSITNVENDR